MFVWIYILKFWQYISSDPSGQSNLPSHLCTIWIMAPSQHCIQFVSSVPSEHSKRPLHKNSDYEFGSF